ncbi:MAG: hypothetical protein KME29_09680 [Calothrix sp. FI2-JRJ7]|jgi:predicted NACHT family NTPase|nr:hypothetical protein [Calothrix sp. FI2-JRJ7]
MPRSLKVRRDCIEKVKLAVRRNGFPSQRILSEEVGLALATVSSFLTGKAVDHATFEELCQRLALDWREIADLDFEAPTETINIDELVQTARDKLGAYIEERCSTMRVLDMEQPIGLDDIYTSVNILEKITGRIWVTSIEELSKNVSASNFDRFSLGRVREERILGLEAVAKYSKLMILGKPGAGKTTFLKYLASSCIRGKFQEKRISFFITLKDLAEAPKQRNLLTYLNQIFIKYNITTIRILVQTP